VVFQVTSPARGEEQKGKAEPGLAIMPRVLQLALQLTEDQPVHGPEFTPEWEIRGSRLPVRF